MSTPASDKVHGQHTHWPLDKHLMYLAGLSEALGNVTLSSALVHEICEAYNYYRFQAERRGTEIERLEAAVKRLKERGK